ncbi:hypothetical protein QBC35DRAFT_289957 [Podospora australis]|uniref:Uncharacterized protein n=1 Tax=Podospora australis TaxID=1536484 RepID=A0AAN6WPY5_9PEZI|nr:hypothetical protein QBC35DRAFT_289957 [Podospora australis]
MSLSPPQVMASSGSALNPASSMSLGAASPAQPAAMVSVKPAGQQPKAKKTSGIKRVGGLGAMAAVGIGLTRVLVVAATGEDIGDFGGGGGGEDLGGGEDFAAGGEDLGGGGGVDDGASTNVDAGVTITGVDGNSSAGGGGGGGGGYIDTSAAVAGDEAAAVAAANDNLAANHFVNMMNAEANANALSYISTDATNSTNALIADPYGAYSTYPDCSQYI